MEHATWRSFYFLNISLDTCYLEKVDIVYVYMYVYEYCLETNANYIPEIWKISVILCFWLRRRRRLRALSHIPIKFIFAIAIEVPDYKNPMICGINRKNKMASGGHLV